LKLDYDVLLSNLAFNVILRPYSVAPRRGEAIAWHAGIGRGVIENKHSADVESIRASV